MINFNDPVFSDPADERTRVVVDMLTEHVYGEARVTAALRAARLSPGEYELSRARLAWMAAVPDAARSGRLGALIDGVVAYDRAFGAELARRVAEALAKSADRRRWYHNDDPYSCSFVGVRGARAIIDRHGLRRALRDLADEQYRVLIVRGAPRSGKSHTWFLIDHLQTAGKLGGDNLFIRVTTHNWSGQVTGEDLARSLVARLDLNIDLAPSSELDDTRVRKLLDRLVGLYPGRDGVTRWIFLDGLDRPGVQDTARDFAKGLVRLVEDGELRNTRLIVTGLDPLGMRLGYAVLEEEIPVIDRDLVASFLREVTGHLGHTVTDSDLEACVCEILGTNPEERDLEEVERSVIQLVKTRWSDGRQA